MPAILVVEDDKSLGATLSERLTKEGYLTSWAKSLEEARKLLTGESFDLIILDIGLPDGNGLNFAAEIKDEVKTPFMFLTAYSSAESRLHGFEVGADDFIPKPFHLEELLLRVKKVLANHGVLNTVPAGECIINLSARTVTLHDGSSKDISRTEYEILKALIEASPEPVSRESLREMALGNRGEAKTLRSIDNAIVKLRQLIGDGDQQIIRSVRGVGYQWYKPQKFKG
ncbi:MAG: DNA-binding response regulator [Candidatus Dadabacteria bacterium]|nr:MAG: DNA-binding response regulator [Candidatus Dadabacteria bacterium]